ncbi:MAG TPA: glutamate-cysteine ligase family protein [Pyrinomonadaceae bacterium]|nr:glutamate-cysteine ligase family protein [Pyrinomonadaceae bacterium]
MNPDEAATAATATTSASSLAAGAAASSRPGLIATPDEQSGVESRDRAPLPDDLLEGDCAALFAAHLRRGAKPAEEWRCGVEFELFGYDARRDYARLTPAQVQRVLAEFAACPSELIREGGACVESRCEGGDRLTVEPGGQIEFSGAPRRSIEENALGLRRWLARLRGLAEGEGWLFLACGFDPLRTLAEQQWFPKRRYDVMRPYLARRGSRAWDMMTRTCAVQVNLDYGAGEDLAKKFTVGNRLAPVVAAMFANSPFAEGRPTGYKSTRLAAWLDTDPDRAGLAPPALTDDFSPETFVAYALDAPMLFARREDLYFGDVSGVAFRDFAARATGDLRPAFRDWTEHLTTLFTDARLKQHIELRSADAGSTEMALAFQALWKGLLYHAHSLDEALRLAPRLDAHGAHELRAAVARDALTARHDKIHVLPLAKEIVALAAEGLRAVAPEEVPCLDILRARVCNDELSPADILLRNWHGRWHASPEKLVAHLRVA